MSASVCATILPSGNLWEWGSQGHPDQNMTFWENSNAACVRVFVSVSERRKRSISEGGRVCVCTSECEKAEETLNITD